MEKQHLTVSGRDNFASHCFPRPQLNYLETYLSTTPSQNTQCSFYFTKCQKLASGTKGHQSTCTTRFPLFLSHQENPEENGSFLDFTRQQESQTVLRFEVLGLWVRFPTAATTNHHKHRSCKQCRSTTFSSADQKSKMGLKGLKSRC